MWMLLWACADNSMRMKDENNALAERYLLRFSEYRSWSQLLGWEGLLPSTSPHGITAQIWLNDIALDAVSHEYDTPYGSAIIHEGYWDEEGLETQAISLMVKQEDFSTERGDWFWAVFGTDGGVREAGDIALCSSCHQSSSIDYILFTQR